MRKIVLIIILIVNLTIYSSDIYKITAGPESNPGVIISSAIIKEAYSRMNMEIEIQSISWSRSIEMANSGESDAELFRTQMVQDKFKNIIIIDEPLLIKKI